MPAERLRRRLRGYLDRGWMDRAECASIPGFTELPHWVSVPICLNRCPVRLECLGYAIAIEQADGDHHPRQLAVYGGTTGPQRDRLQAAKR